MLEASGRPMSEYNGRLMASKNMLVWFAFGTAALFAVGEGFARCLDSPTYYCASAVFEKEIQGLRLPGASKDCAGLIAVSGKSVTAVLFGEVSCPAPGTRLAGHLMKLCQERRQWTKAEYGFSREQAFCSKTHEEALREAQALATKIRPGMTRKQVRDALLDYPCFEHEQYFIYPDVGLTVPYDLTGGSDGFANKVDGPVKITTMAILHPWQPLSDAPWFSLPDPPSL